MDTKADRWVQRAAVATLVAVATLLLGVGIVLYAPSSSHAAPRTMAR